jgi:hypothetical protein
MNLLNKQQFTEALTRLPKKVSSKSGKASYSQFRQEGNMLVFKRDNTGYEWSINIDELFTAYQQLDFINTNNIRQYVSGMVYSPSCAVLIALGLYDGKGNRLK